MLIIIAIIIIIIMIIIIIKNNNNKIMKISSQWLNRLKGVFVISKLHKSLSGLSHLGKTCLIYVPKKIPFA